VGRGKRAVDSVGKKTLRLSKSCIGVAEKKAVMDVLDGGFLGMGSKVQAFEIALSKFFGRPAICVVNGTAALHLALQASGIGRNDEVLVQSLTYVASFQAISATGAIPIACDIDPITCGIDLEDASKRITKQTRAIMPVHYAGGVGDLDEIYTFAEKHGLRVIEDGAHAFGTQYKGQIVGGFGDISCFSFDGIKNITSGEGGCIVSDDKDVIEKIKNARLLGVENDTEKRFSGSRSWSPDVNFQGWRYHMSDIMAAIGIVQLENFGYHKTQRQELAKGYANLLSKEPLITFFDHDYNFVVPHIFVVVLDSSIDREVVMSFLSERGIPAGIHYKPNHTLSFFKNQSSLPLPTTDGLYPRLLTLPLHPELDFDDLLRIVSVLSEVVNKNAK